MGKAKKYCIIEEEFWDDPRFDLGDKHFVQLLYFRLWSFASTDHTNIVRMDKYRTNYLCTRFSVSQDLLKQAVEVLAETGLLRLARNKGTEIVVFPTSIQGKYPHAQKWDNNAIPDHTDTNRVPNGNHMDTTRGSVQNRTEPEPEPEHEHKQEQPRTGGDAPCVPATSTDREQSTSKKPKESAVAFDTETRQLLKDIIESYNPIWNGSQVPTRMKILSRRFCFSTESKLEAVAKVERERLVKALVYVFTNKVRSLEGTVFTYAIELPTLPKSAKAKVEALTQELLNA